MFASIQALHSGKDGKLMTNKNSGEGKNDSAKNVLLMCVHR